MRPGGIPELDKMPRPRGSAVRSDISKMRSRWIEVDVCCRCPWFDETDRRITSWSPTSCDKNGKNLSSDRPLPATRMLEADHSFLMPCSPKASTPWSQPWKKDERTMPREP